MLLLTFTLLLLSLFMQNSLAYQTISNNGKTYAYEVEEQATKRAYSQDQTEEWCKRLGGHLPSLHSQSDIDFLYNLAIKTDNKGYVFLGGRALEDKWSWDDGSPMDFGDISSDMCHYKSQPVNECGLAVLAYPGANADKTIVYPFRSRNLSQLRLCQMPAS